MPRSRWVGHIKMYLKKINVNTRSWVDSAQDRGYWKGLVNVAFNLRIS
jgi:hypothetical protein